MKKIANIISKVELTNHKKLDWINYLSSVDDCNLKLPTLIIGWDYFKTQISFLSANILEKKVKTITPLWWEFSMEEKMTDHFTGVENFVKIAPREFVNIFKYTSIDPIRDKIETVEDLWAKLPAMEFTYYQYKDEIIYVYNKTRGEIYGIYLTAFNYFGLANEIIGNFFANKTISKTIDSDGSIYQSYYKHFPDFDQLKRSMVLFLN